MVNHSLCITIISGILSVIVIEYCCSIFKGMSFLTYIIIICRKSKYFKWLAYNVIGNEDWYYIKYEKNTSNA